MHSVSGLEHLFLWNSLHTSNCSQRESLPFNRLFMLTIAILFSYLISFNWAEKIFKNWTRVHSGRYATFLYLTSLFFNYIFVYKTKTFRLDFGSGGIIVHFELTIQLVIITRTECFFSRLKRKDNFTQNTVPKNLD